MEVLTLVFSVRLRKFTSSCVFLKHKIIGEVDFKSEEMKQQLVAYCVLGQVISSISYLNNVFLWIK